MSNIREVLQERILVLDGAMGTMIQRYGLKEADFRNESLKHIEIDLKGNNDILSLTRPEIIAEIHSQYLDAGADIIETNTFNANAISQSDYGTEGWVYDINFQSAKLAKVACLEYESKHPDTKKFVAGALGPTNQTASMSPDVNDPAFRATSFEDLRRAYAEQCLGLIEGGADIILIETIFDTLNAKAAIFAAKETINTLGKDIPIMISATITDRSGRTLSGQTLEAFLISVAHSNMLTIGLNCAFGAEQLLPYTKILRQKTSCLLSVYPNAGLPNEFGQYDQSPALMKEKVKPFIELGLVSIIGGCCGTTPDHIRAIAELVQDSAAYQNLQIHA